MASGTVKYALRAGIALAEAYENEGKVLSSSKITEAEKLPAHYGETIVNSMRHAELLTATKGKNGGYRLARAPDQISVADVVLAIDGHTTPVECVRGAGRRCTECPEDLPCLLRRMFARANERLVEEYRSVTLADLLAERRNGHGGA